MIGQEDPRLPAARTTCSPISRRSCASTTCYGRRDNKYKARIKILVHETGAEEIRARRSRPSAQRIQRRRAEAAAEAEIERIARLFRAAGASPQRPAACAEVERCSAADPRLRRCGSTTTCTPHRHAGLRHRHHLAEAASAASPGDATADADGARRRPRRALLLRRDPRQPRAEPGAAACRASTTCRRSTTRSDGSGFAEANAGLITDIIACPGLDYCALANARSIPIAQRISERFAELARQHEIGELKIKISGCINACGHHHVGHIGILGVEKKGEELYQITLGGDGDGKTAIGKILGPALSADKVVEAVDAMVETYLDNRGDGERFLDTYRRIGAEPFKERVYAAV